MWFLLSATIVPLYGYAFECTKQLFIVNKNSQMTYLINPSLPDRLTEWTNSHELWLIWVNIFFSHLLKSLWSDSFGHPCGWIRMLRLGGGTKRRRGCRRPKSRCLRGSHSGFRLYLDASIGPARWRSVNRSGLVVSYPTHYIPRQDKSPMSFRAASINWAGDAGRCSRVW